MRAWSIYTYSSPTCNTRLQCSRNRALRLHSCAIADQGFYRLVQRVNNDARVLCDLWRIKRTLYKGRAVFVCNANMRGSARAMIILDCSAFWISTCLKLLLVYYLLGEEIWIFYKKQEKCYLELKSFNTFRDYINFNVKYFIFLTRLCYSMLMHSTCIKYVNIRCVLLLCLGIV